MSQFLLQIIEFLIVRIKIHKNSKKIIEIFTVGTNIAYILYIKSTGGLYDGR